MGQASVDQVLSYPFASHVQPDAVVLAPQLPGDDQSPFFFQGDLSRPRRTADQFRALMDVVHSRHHVPAAMLARILRESDPVITANDDRLRLEAFSGCCSLYARVDLLSDAIDNCVRGRGTTNVDFNSPMLAALGRVRPSDTIRLSIGDEGVELASEAGPVVEKRVALPLRWLRGFVEVQAAQKRMTPAFTVDAVHATRFLRSLPRMNTSRRTAWVAASGKGLRFTQVETPGAVSVAGLQRLKVLEPLCADAETLSVFGDEVTGASAWVLEYSDSRFTLTLSPEVWRGFSGEGQALLALATRNQSDIPVVRAQLKWQGSIDVEALAAATGLDSTQVHDALAVLGTRGLVGYDVAAGCYFHRELPFDLTMVEILHPRLVAARKLLDGNAVRVATRSLDSTEAFVTSGDVEHRVAGSGQPREWTCTCTWFAKHEGQRGPCTHVLATEIEVGE